VNPLSTSPANGQPRRNVAGLQEPLPALDITPDLVARIHRGDEAALETLINRYVPVLRRICHSRLRGHPQLLLETDDVVQDALICIVRRIPQFVWRHPGGLLAYLSRVIRNRIIDAKRKAARHGEWVELPEHCVAEIASPAQASRSSADRDESGAAIAVSRDRSTTAHVIDECGTRRRCARDGSPGGSVRKCVARIQGRLPQQNPKIALRAE
jgi:RNA polymerase sigma factor (sigma-70 family)